MSILEWLTPDFFALNVILVALLMNLTIYGIVSNFTEDFQIGEKLQTGIYTSLTAICLVYIFLVILGFAGVMPRYPYLYDNKYNFLLLGTGSTFGGNGPVFISIIIGLIAGILVGLQLGANRALRIFFATSAMACEGLIVAMTLLWIVNQT